MKYFTSRLWVLCGAVAILVLLVVPHTASADPYGRGSYSKCPYASCKPTQVVLPSGLKVSINLTDGQIIPRTGYTIIITPLNGSGSSFKHASFTVDTISAGNALPDVTGTAEWFWDPVAIPGTTIIVAVTDTDDTVTTHAFHVRIADESAIVATAPARSMPKSTGITALLDFASDRLDKLSQSAVRAIQALPKPLAYSFPYILFGLLGLNTLLLLFQMQREVREYHILRSLLAREKVIAESKKTLMELVSHYLRTPITIVLGGIDMLPKDPQTAETASKMQTVAKNIGKKIEGLIADTRTASEIALAQRGDAALSATALWRQPGLFIPVLSILIILIPYNYLAQHGGALSITQVSLAIQLIAFLAIVTAMYLVFRQLRLHKRDQQELQHLRNSQLASDRIRDELVNSTATTLHTDLNTVDTLAGQLPPSQATIFIHEGQKRFHDILTKCTIAASLRGSHSRATPVLTTIKSLIETAQKPLGNKLLGHRIQIAQTNTPLTIQNPELVAHVLHTVLDNAITYSHKDGTVNIDIYTTPAGTDITVTDKGEGMPATKVSQLFQPFFKIEGAERFNHEGMGFSLYLDKLIMEYLDGGISLVSQKGHGTTVTLHLPTTV
jgi:signal transduction histidine kinase